MQDSCYKNEVTCKVKDTKGGGRDPGLFLDRFFEEYPIGLSAI